MIEIDKNHVGVDLDDAKSAEAYLSTCGNADAPPGMANIVPQE
jgi:hypothetical protein